MNVVIRIMPANNAPEREMLVAWLEFHRATLEMKCEGLSADELRRRAVEPSALSLLGLVRHMAEVERNWFRRALVDEDAPPIFYSDDDPDGDFNVEDADVAEAFGYWAEECRRAREIVEQSQSLDVVGKARRSSEAVSLRWILNHMIEEYARHNGHADLLRERIDGQTGD